MKDKNIMHLIMSYYEFDVICARDVAENVLINVVCNAIV